MFQPHPAVPFRNRLLRVCQASGTGGNHQHDVLMDACCAGLFSPEKLLRLRVRWIIRCTCEIRANVRGRGHDLMRDYVGREIVTECYPSKECPSASYPQRTEWNVRDSDAHCFVFHRSRLELSSMKTVEFARKHNKPCPHLYSRQRDAADRFESFLQDNGVQILNVAGPRASKEPSVAQFVIETFDSVFRS